MGFPRKYRSSLNATFMVNTVLETSSGLSLAMIYVDHLNGADGPLLCRAYGAEIAVIIRRPNMIAT